MAKNDENPKTGHQTREGREAEALRANLRRRKEQQRAWATAPKPSESPEKPL